jgi:uncharacterized protein YndB with AHSA1/START domain
VLGRLEPLEDGRWALTFERRLAHPTAKVWRALTEVEQLQAWFVQVLDYDRSRLHFDAGATLTFVPKGGHGEMPTGRGHVTQVDPPRLLEYTWDTETLRWELESDGDAGCHLIFTNILEDRASARAVASGWHAGLDMLGASLDGRQPEESEWERLEADYERALG